MKSNVLSSLAVIATALLPLHFAAGIKAPMRHGPSWKPEYVLVATAENITINCQSRYSTVFNGTSPGPTIRLEEGRTTWVRVWNRIENENVTVVSNPLQTSSPDIPC
jgi:FtsP/CotA-like multicopper oxidase with cupredoxin domain